MPFPTWLAGQRITADALQEMMPLRADKTVTSTYTNATVTNDPELFLNLPAAGTYRVELHSFFALNTDNACDVRVGFGYTSGNWNFGAIGSNSGITTGSTFAGEWLARTDAPTGQFITVGLSSTQALHAYYKGVFRANSAQTLFAMYAQNVASAQVVSVIDGSYMTAWRVA